MRLNAFIAHNTSYSRREADELIVDGRVMVNGGQARIGQQIVDTDNVEIDGEPIAISGYVYLMLHKPMGYVCSRRGQGAPTVYELLPPEYHQLTTVGRLDKNTSGLLLLSNDGQFTQEMTHPSRQKRKTYHVTLMRPLTPSAMTQIARGVDLEDGRSTLELEPMDEVGHMWRVSMHEGRNRQIRRTFTAVGNEVKKLHRVQLGPYRLDGLKSGEYREIEPKGKHHA